MIINGQNYDAIKIDGHLYTMSSVEDAVCAKREDARNKFKKALHIIKDNDKELYEDILEVELEMGYDASILEIDEDAEYWNSIPKEPLWRRDMITPHRH